MSRFKFLAQKFLLLKEWQLAILLGGGIFLLDILDVLPPLLRDIIYHGSMTLIALWYGAVVFVLSPNSSRQYKFWNYTYILVVLVCLTLIWARGLILPDAWFYDTQTGNLNFKTGILINAAGVAIWLFLVGFACHILLIKEEEYFGKYKSDSLFTFLQFFFLFIGVFFLGKRIKNLLECENEKP